MAKPISAGRRAGCSTHSQSYSRSENINSYRSPPRRRRRAHSALGPSPAILSLLATISASTAAHGSPTPPPFLCPSLDVPHIPARRSQTTRSRGTAHSKARRSPRLIEKTISSPRHVPDKFEMDDNGQWRRVETYTLYGSTVCFPCRDSATPVASVDDEIHGPPSPSNHQATPSSSAGFNIHDNLPPGWKLPSGSGGRTTLILALSLLLAFLICFLIIGCLFWRKSRHRKRKQRDIEMKVSRQHSQCVDDDTRASILMVEREIKVKQKIWARATARWKANARYTARQRRGKRTSIIMRMNSPQNSCASLDRMEDTRTSQAPAPSPTVSHHSSMESLHLNILDVPALGSPPSEQTSAVEAPVPSSLPRAPSPPAYHLRVTAPTTHASSEGQRTDRGSDRPPPSPRGSLYPPSLYVQSSDTAGNSESLSSQAVHAAHVATDDKSLLARLADLASAPPTDDTTASHGDPAMFNVSAPIWQDELLEDFGEVSHGCPSLNLHLSGYTSRSSSPVPLFPPPPSKGKMAASSFYDYAFEDASAESDPGPSAPPFEEESHCPLNVTELIPSAPPLPEMEASYYTGPYSSAPDHDWGSTIASDPGENVEPPETQEQNAAPNSSAAPGPRELEPVTEPSILPVHGPIARDGTPPSYQP